MFGKMDIDLRGGILSILELSITLISYATKMID